MLSLGELAAGIGERIEAQSSAPLRSAENCATVFISDEFG